MKKRLGALALVSAFAVFLVMATSSSADISQSPKTFKTPMTNEGATLSGSAEFRDMDLGTGITECPQAGMNTEPQELRRRQIDQVEQLSSGGDDRRTNTEYSCFPQNETSIDVNPAHPKNLVAGQNDYRNGFPFTGFDASTDGGKTWYDGIIPFPSTPTSAGNAGFVPSGGDPAVTIDRAGVAYMAQLGGNRHNDDNGIFVARSTNGGFTWSRACAAINVGTPTDDQARCGSIGDPRKPGDGTVVYQPDNNNTSDFSVTFHDKEYIASGPRPAGVNPTCFAPETRTPIPPGNPGCPTETIGVDRLYVTWTAFNNPVGVPGFIVSSTIELSYSDDQGRSWSPRRTINGSAPFCAFAFAGPNFCDDNQFSVPTVNPTNGLLGVAFENFNTPSENQVLFVRSADGGNTFAGPFFVTPVFDINLQLRPDCAARTANRVSLTNSCFRVPTTLGVVADQRGGAFNDDFYVAMWDNRNGTRVSTNGDVFFFKSIDGGSSWIGPTRVNNDPSAHPANRDCTVGPGPNQCPANVHTGNDQWWPWIDVSKEGDLNVMFKDRRLDTNSVAHEWPTSRQRPGNYLVWTWGAQCRITGSTVAAGQQCVAPTASVIPQPTAPINPTAADQFPQSVFPFRNFKISDVPSNWDYSFRAGIFAGDYDVVAVGPSGRGGDDDDDDDDDDGGATAYAHFTDARNGRSSGGPAGTDPPVIPSQPGRNPACEQSDVFVDSYDARNAGSGGSAGNITPFLVTLCPADAQDPGSDDDDDDDDDDD